MTADTPRPKLHAEFVMADGHVEGVDGNYRIKLTVTGAPAKTHAVTYYLHETYYDAIREVRNRKTNYAENITSYGDYEVQVKIRTPTQPYVVKRTLLDALRERHGESTNPSIQKALRDLAEN
jgi:hypothetical protein